MTAVTQIIPNYLGGVSKQPDEKKMPGQVIDILNGYPDPTDGLSKRNGLEFVATLDTDTTGLDEAAWFFINRDETELYFGCVTTEGKIRIWDVLNRIEVPSSDITYVDGSDSYLEAGNTWKDYKFLTVQDVTFVVNKNFTVLQDYGKDENNNYREHPLPYEPNNVATIKIQTVAYNTDYEVFLKSDNFIIPPVKYTSPQPPSIGATVKLLTASDIIDGIAEQIPTEFFDVTKLNTSIELRSKNFIEGAIQDTNSVKLYRDESGFLYFTEDPSEEKIYITFNDEFVSAFYFGADWEAAAIVRDGGIKLAFKKSTDQLRIADISDTGVWDGTYNEVDKIPEIPGDTPTPPDNTDYWAEEDLFQADFDGDRFVGDPSNGDNVDLIFTQVAVNTRDEFFLQKDQYEGLYIKAGSNPPIKLTTSSGDPYINPNAIGVGQNPDGFYGRLWSIATKTDNGARDSQFYQSGAFLSSGRGTLEDGTTPFYEFEDLCYVDINGDGFIGDPQDNILAPEKPPVEIVNGSPFTIEVKAGQDGEGLDAYQSEVENGARLTRTSVQDRRVKILNTSDETSSYFVKFVANRPEDPIAGQGYWEEDLGWDEYDGNKDVEPYIALAAFGVQEETMPHVLEVPEPGKFEFNVYPYTKRLVGSEISNRSPSFANNTITNVFLDNNRLGFLSGESVILSQNGEFGNFYYVSAQTTIESDPIDLNCSSLRPAKLHTALANAQGLVLFSKFEQFMLFSESGTLTPSDAVIRSISKYETEPLISPVDVGTSIMFVSKTPSMTRTMGMITRGLQDNPIVVDISKVAAGYVPREIDIVNSSPQNSFIAMSGKDHNNMYFYRFFNNGEKDVMQAWFRWELPGDVQSHIVAQDTLFMVVKTDRGYQLLQSPLSQSNVIQDKVNLRFDNYFACNDPRLDGQELVYDAEKNRTKLPSPYTLPVSDRYIAYFTSEVNVNASPRTVDEACNRILHDVNDGNNLVGGGFLSEVTIEGQEWFIDGDWSGNDEDGIPWRNRMLVGERYDFEVELPDTYFRQAEIVSDYSAVLTLARYKFSLGESGEVNFFSKARGSEEWNMVGAVPDANYYNADTPAITNETILTVPIYQRNKNFDFKIQADTPLPVSLNSMMWEGKYSPRNYRRN